MGFPGGAVDENFGSYPTVALLIQRREHSQFVVRKIFKSTTRFAFDICGGLSNRFVTTETTAQPEGKIELFVFALRIHNPSA